MTTITSAAPAAPATPPPTGSEIADTYGWDTAFAIRVDDVNAAIVSAKSSPASFQAQGTDEMSGTRFTADGTFGDWQITLGGSGTLIHMLTPIPRMTVTAGTKQYVFSGGEAVIEVELEYIPHDEQPDDPAKGTLHNLVVKTAAADPSGNPVVTINRMSFPQDGWSEFDAIVAPAVQAWFNENLADFAHVFATVNLGRTADKGQFQWLLPTYTSYAYIDRATQDDSLLGILSMTGGRSADGLAEEISPNAIPAGARAGFLISSQRYLYELLLPSMPLVFKGTSVSDYSVTGDHRSIVLNAPVQLSDVQYNGNSYSPQLQSLTITADAQLLTIDSTTKTEVSWEIWSLCHSVQTYQVVLKDRGDGSQTLDFEPVGTPVQEHWTEKGEGIVITEIIADIIGAVVVAVVGVLTGGAGFAIAALVVGLLAGLASQIPNLIATVGTDDAPPMTLLVFNSVDPLQWADQQDFTLTSAGLNLSLQLGGTPHFGGASAARG